MKGEPKLKPEQAVKDTDRVEYFKGYTKALLDAATEDGVKIGSYLAWSALFPAAPLPSARLSLVYSTQVYWTTLNGKSDEW